MAHFIGYVKGNRGEASRLGSKSSGIDATARGWKIGGSVTMYYDKEKDRDVVIFYVSAGSNGSRSPQCIGSYVRTKDGDFKKIKR